MARRAFLSWALIGILGASNAHAFKGFEHRRVSRDALCLALDYMGERMCAATEPEFVPVARAITAGDQWRCNPKDDKNCCGALNLSLADKANLQVLLAETASNISYADFVAFVDYVLDPIKLVQRDTSITGLPAWPKDLDEDFLFRLRSRPTLHAWAARGNDSHFQSQMMMSWWLWHRHAVIAAAQGNGQDASRSSERLFSGLVLNAISNHYLEDFFAPGHVVTMRESMQDAAAMSMHDFYNREGANFEVDPSHADELLLLLAPDRHDQLLAIPAPQLKLIKEKGLPSLLRFRGDGYLLPSDRKLGVVEGLAEEATNQRLFVTLVIARTIVDVLESYGCQRPVNSFPDYSWSPMLRLRGPDGRYVLPTGGMRYGKYEDQTVKRINYGLLTYLEVSSQSAILGELDDARGVVSGVVVPTFIWAPPPGMSVDDVYVARHVVPTIALGLGYRMDRQLPGYGAFVRFSLLSPRLDLNIGAAVGVERYTFGDVETYRFHPEIRVGVGASLLILFGGIGYDHALDSTGQLQRGLTARSGVQFSIPWSKIPR